MKSRIKIALIQMFSEKGAIDENLARIAHYLDEAARRGIDIVGLPEMCLTGYADPTRYPQAVITLDGPEVARFRDMTRPYPMTVLAGLIEKNPNGKPFISQIVARQGELLGYYRKRTIKDNEVEWFSSGWDVPVWQHDGLTYGIAICADIHNAEVYSELAKKGAQLVFELAAPGLYGEQATHNWRSGFEWWHGECDKYLSAYAREHEYWIAVATQAGRTVDEDFPGGGYLFAPNGERLFATPDWSPGVAYLEIDLYSNRLVSAEIE